MVDDCVSQKGASHVGEVGSGPAAPTKLMFDLMALEVDPENF
jgi:hypothetical protein